MRTEAMKRRLERLEQHKKLTNQEQLVEFVTFWADEEVPDDGSPVFVTEWGGGALEEDKEESIDE